VRDHLRAVRDDDSDLGNAVLVHHLAAQSDGLVQLEIDLVDHAGLAQIAHGTARPPARHISWRTRHDLLRVMNSERNLEAPGVVNTQNLTCRTSAGIEPGILSKLFAQPGPAGAAALGLVSGSSTNAAGR
jgi:hypothetical protein